MRRKSLTLPATGVTASGRASTTLRQGGARLWSSGVRALGCAKRWFTVLRFTLAVSGVDASGRANTTFGQGGASFRSSGVTASGRANTTFTANLHPTREPVKPAENRLKKKFFVVAKKEKSRSCYTIGSCVAWLGGLATYPRSRPGCRPAVHHRDLLAWSLPGPGPASAVVVPGPVSPALHRQRKRCSQMWHVC